MHINIAPFAGIEPDIDDSAILFPGVHVIGRVRIAAKVSLWPGVVLRGDVDEIVVGERSNIQDGTVIHVDSGGHSTIIGADVLIGHLALVHGTKIHDRGFVGMGAITMDGCVIEEDGMLAAGAMLTAGKRIKKGELWTGRPAKFARMLRGEEITRNQMAAEHYWQLAQAHRQADGA